MSWITPFASKLLLTLSNLVALYPFWKSTNRTDGVVLLYACVSSIVHHSVETRYYEPALWEWSERAAWWFLKNDQFGAVMAIFVLASWKLLQKEWFVVVMGFAFMFGSELVMYMPFLTASKKVLLRTVLHVPWHFLSLGYMAYRAVTIYQKEERLYEWLVRRLLGIVD